MVSLRFGEFGVGAWDGKEPLPSPGRATRRSTIAIAMTRRVSW